MGARGARPAGAGSTSHLRTPRDARQRRGRNFGSVTSSSIFSNTTSTGIPMRRSSLAQSTTFVCSRMPSSSSTIATLYGASAKKAGMLRAVHDDERVDASRGPTSVVHSCASARHFGQTHGRREAEVAAGGAALRREPPLAAARPSTGAPSSVMRGQRLVDDEHQAHSGSVAVERERRRRAPRAGTRSTARLNAAGCSSIGRCPHCSSTCRRACGRRRSRRSLRRSGTSRSSRPQTTSDGLRDALERLRPRPSARRRASAPPRARRPGSRAPRAAPRGCAGASTCPMRVRSWKFCWKNCARLARSTRGPVSIWSACPTGRIAAE